MNNHSVCVALGYSEIKKAKNIIIAGVDGEESLTINSLWFKTIDNISKNVPLYSFTPTRHTVLEINTFHYLMTKIIIPARIKSTRLPEKVLRGIEGLPLFVDSKQSY